MSLIKRIATGIVLLLALAILFSLGTWQVKRLHWKEGLLAQIEARRSAEPVDLSVIEQAQKTGKDQEYARVRVTGSFDHAHERHFFATHQGASGFYIYTPMMLAADGRVLFVNRGFVPYEMKQQQTRPAGQVTGDVTITGYLRNRLAEKPSSLVPDNDLAKNIFYWKDWSAMVETVGLDASSVLPFFVDADDRVKNPGGFPLGGVTQFDLPNNHLQYALTWYGLAAALVAVSGIMLFRRKP
ncbi:SURF1 family protein [Rhizobium sp. FY34]|uniref:SURF1 family protein n=1 Tax=Rhizobium sp. FY34 TaxID=2562309 RepID=UPI001FF06C0E|nr:SURF1 family protein [Rhizobium sp. FY34]